MLDKQGNAEADNAADLGRRHQSEVLIDARRRLLGTRSHWYPIMTDLHRLMLILPLFLVHLGFCIVLGFRLILVTLLGLTLLLGLNSVGILVKITSFLKTLHWPSGTADLGHFGISFLELVILFEQRAGHRLLSEKVTRPHVRAYCLILISSVPVTEGIEIPPVIILVRFTSFLGTLHWPSVLLIWVILGVSFLELLILFEQWAGHRLLSEKVTRPHVRAGRSILLPSVPVSEGIEIRHGCQFLSSLVRALAKLPGVLGRFLPCSLGSHMSRLRHLGRNQRSHGLTSRPLESCHHQCLRAICGVLGYPKGSALELLDGTLKLRYCTDLFTMRFSPPPCLYLGLVLGLAKGIFITLGNPLDTGGNRGKRVRLTRKRRPGATSDIIRDPGHPLPRRWKRLRPPFLRRSGG